MQYRNFQHSNIEFGAPKGEENTMKEFLTKTGVSFFAFSVWLIIGGALMSFFGLNIWGVAFVMFLIAAVCMVLSFLPWYAVQKRIQRAVIVYKIKQANRRDIRAQNKQA